MHIYDIFLGIAAFLLGMLFRELTFHPGRRAATPPKPKPEPLYWTPNAHLCPHCHHKVSEHISDSGRRRGGCHYSWQTSKLCYWYPIGYGSKSGRYFKDRHSEEALAFEEAHPNGHWQTEIEDHSCSCEIHARDMKLNQKPIRRRPYLAGV